MIFNLTSGGGNVGPIIPVFSGAHNFVTSPSGKSGYIEIFESGTLAWTGAVLPAKVDITCVGAGAGGTAATQVVYSENITYFVNGAGGGGGEVETVIGVEIPEVTDIIVGAGGAVAANGGTTSVGSLCVAKGGTAAVFKYYYNSYEQRNFPCGVKGGSGGNYGGLPRAYGWANGNQSFTDSAALSSGGSNGAIFPAFNYAYHEAGTSKGSPTVDILGRIHAGGGAAGRYLSTSTGITSTLVGWPGGESDFTSGSGTQGSTASRSDAFSGTNLKSEGGYGGGGYGGGGGGGAYAGTTGNTPSLSSGSPGGNGFVIIGWGDYLSLYTAA